MARILIVDDQPAVLKMVESVLARSGHVCVSASDGMDGIERAKALPFDLIISDAVMPGGVSGFDLVKTIRADGRLSDMPIILLTGKNERRDVERAIQVGVNEYLVKPVNPELLTAKVTQLLGGKKKGAPTAEITVSEMALLQLPILVVRLSESHASVKAPVALPAGAKISLAGTVLGKIGLAQVSLRVLTCEREGADAASATFTMRGQLTDLSDADKQKLKLWVQNFKPAGRAA